MERKQEKKRIKKLLLSALCFCTMCICGVLFNELTVCAAEKTISVKDDDSLNVKVNTGDTGTIVPIQNTMEYDVIDYDEAGNPVYEPNTWNQVVRYEYSAESYSDKPCIKIDQNGRYETLNPGSGEVRVTGYNSNGNSVFSADVYFNVQLSMSEVKLAKTSVKCSLIPIYNYGNSAYYGDAEFDIKVKSPVELDQSMSGINLRCKSSNKKVRVVSSSLSKNVLHIKVHADKKCTTNLTITIAKKKFKVKVSFKPVKISATSLLLENGNTKKLKVSGYSGRITWSSSNNAVATVSSSGVIKGKKIGNAVITAKLGKKRIGCAVSVTTGTLIQVCNRATYIGTHWQYSQPLRTQPGYYDCSALVWKAYKECAGLTFGNASYPGTTRTESAWCRANNRMISGGYTYKKVTKMQLNPGDLVFKSEDLGNPYNTTYHVEMFTGYTCIGYDSKNKPIVTSRWASRSDGYGAEDGSLLARPIG